jgi:hypothetical protein
MEIRLRRHDEDAALLAIWERAVRATHRFLSEDDIVSFRPVVADELADLSFAWWVLHLARRRDARVFALPNRRRAKPATRRE